MVGVEELRDRREGDLLEVAAGIPDQLQSALRHAEDRGRAPAEGVKRVVDAFGGDIGADLLVAERLDLSRRQGGVAVVGDAEGGGDQKVADVLGALQLLGIEEGLGRESQIRHCELLEPPAVNVIGTGVALVGGDDVGLAIHFIQSDGVRHEDAEDGPVAEVDVTVAAGIEAGA